MAEFYKLLFDLSLYYTLTGWYLSIFAHVAPSAAGFIALAACAALDSVFRARNVKNSFLRILPLLLPLAALLTRPSLWQCLQCLPAWAYLIFSVRSGSVHMNYREFQAHFGFGLKTLLLLIFGFVISLAVAARLSDAIMRTVPYLVLMLASGVCMLRMLRENRPEGVRQGIYMLLFILLCAGLTLGRAPQLLMKGVGLLYHGLIVPCILVIAVIFGAVAYVFYVIIAWFLAHVRGDEDVPTLVSPQGIAEMLGIEEQYETYTGNFQWLKILLIVLAAAALLFLLFLLFRHLLGESKASDSSETRLERRNAIPGARTADKVPRLIRPRDPRLAVRYYYAKFLAECISRGQYIPVGMTVEELSKCCAPLFPGEDVTALAEIYSPARYHLRGNVSQEDVRLASEAWHALRRSKQKKTKS